MREPTRIPWCRRCELPIVPTFLIAFKEFYCTGCGNSWGYFTEPTIEATPERLAAREAHIEEFQRVTKPCIVTHSKLQDCPRCFGPDALGNDHSEHATPEEVAASTQAWAALREMRKEPVGHG